MTVSCGPQPGRLGVGRRSDRRLVLCFACAITALLEDLQERGLLDDTLVMWMGEFGRTPRLNRNGGRDHWGFCQSVLLAGTGVRGGQVYGSSDAQGRPLPLCTGGRCWG